MMNDIIELKLKEIVIKQMQVNISFKTLGVHSNPILDWKYQFKYIKNKMMVMIKTLMRT